MGVMTRLSRHSIPAPLRRAVFGLSYEEVGFGRRGFHDGDRQVRLRLEAVGGAFLRGYHVALDEADPARVGQRLDAEPPATGPAETGSGRGIPFAYEGAAMALAVLDGLPVRGGSRLGRFLDGPARRCVYTAHVGAGWALARLPRWRWRVVLRQLDPVLRWLAFDGHGFHDTYFRRRPARLDPGYPAHAYAQGVGRALWFVHCAEIDRIAADIAGRPVAYRGDLWSGVALAATFAGGASPDALSALREAAGDCGPQVAQGAAFAAKARLACGEHVGHTGTAVRILAGCSVEAAAETTDRTRIGLRADGDIPAYEVWRRLVARELRTLAGGTVGGRHVG